MRCRFELLQPVVPARPVVIVCGQSLLLRIQQNPDELLRLRSRLHSSDPRQCIPVEIIKFPHVRRVVAEIGPTKVLKVTCVDDCPERSLALLAELLRRGGGIRPVLRSHVSMCRRSDAAAPHERYCKKWQG